MCKNGWLEARAFPFDNGQAVDRGNTADGRPASSRDQAGGLAPSGLACVPAARRMADEIKSKTVVMTL